MKKRKIKTSLYFFLAALFLFGATFLAIIISQGGSVSEDGVVTNSGVLRVNVDPENINFRIFIDEIQVDNLVNKGTNVSAGVHTVRIEADNMNTWTKKVTITQGIVTDIAAKLFPLNLKLEQLTTSNINKISFSKGGDFLFYLIYDPALPNDNGIWRLQLNQNNLFFFNGQAVPVKFAEINADIISMLQDPDFEILPSPDSNKALLLSPQQSKSILLNNLNSNETKKAVDLVSELGFYPEFTDWLNDSISLIVYDNNALFEYDLTAKRSTLIKYNPQSPIIYDSNAYHVLWYDEYNKELMEYKSQTNQVLPIISGLITPEITNIYLPPSNPDYALIRTTLSYQLLDIKRQALTTLEIDPQFYQLINISADATTYLFKDAGLKLLTLTAKENIALNKLDLATYELPVIQNETDEISFSPQGSNVLVYKKQENTIYTLDQDGSNMLTLLKSPVSVETFGFDSQLDALYILMQDSTTPEDLTTLPSSNIYKIELGLGN